MAEDAAKFAERKIDIEAGNRFQLVQCAAGVAEAAAADHRNGQAAGCHDGSEDKRGFVANASGGVLVHFFAEDFGMVEDFSGVQHHFGERRELGAVHAADPHRHQPRGHLVIRNVAARIAGNEKINFFAGKFPGITFLADQVDGAHAFGKANGERNIRYRGRQRDAR